MGSHDVAETWCPGELKVANETPPTVVLFETPVTVSLVGEESRYFDFAVLLMLMTAKSNEGSE